MSSLLTVSQVRVHGPGDVRVDEVNAPKPGPRDALVRVAACGICGTDLTYIRMGGLAGPGPEPLCLGHEIAGTVEWVGSDVASVRRGDRVVVEPGNDTLGRIGGGGPAGGLTPLLHVREADAGLLHPIPHEMPFDLAAFAEPLAVGMHAVEQVEPDADLGVAVFGCGPIGLAAIASLVDQGHRQVVAVDMSSTRLRLAESLGAQAALNPAEVDVWQELASLHGTAPFMFGPTPATAAFIEASGSDRVIDDVLSHGRVGGRLAVVALHYRPVRVNMLTVMMKEFTLRGSMEYPARFADSIDLLARRPEIAAVITHRFDLADFGQAVDLLTSSTECGKVMVHCNAD